MTSAQRDTPAKTQPAAQPAAGLSDLLRSAVELFAVVSLSLWGFALWPLPWNIALGLGAPALAVLLWALFRSPKAVLQVDPFVKAIVEIVVMGAAAFAWLGLGQPFVAAGFALTATLSGVVHGRREFR